MKDRTRLIIRCILVVVLGLSIAVITVSLYFTGPETKETYAVIAAALAVVAAVISAWTSQRTHELHEDSLKPYPYPSIDVKTRYGLVQLRVKNFGGSSAHDIFLDWDKPIENSKGEPIRFTRLDGEPEIRVLLPGESASVLIDGALQLFEECTNLNYKGHIRYSDPSGRNYKIPVSLSAEQFRYTLTYDKEEPKTHYKLQQIPDEVKRLSQELARLRRMLEKPPSAEEIERLRVKSKQMPNTLPRDEPGLDGSESAA